MGWEDLDLDLSGVRSVVVVGKNNTGKSSLMDAFSWCCYDRIGRPDIPSMDSLIRDGADSAYVQIAFDSNGHEVVVEREKQRGKTGTLDLIVDGVSKKRHTVPETFGAIAKMIGLPYEALMAGPFMVQETAGAFMKARPAARKDLLATLFGLGRYEMLHEAAKKKRAEAEGQLAAAEEGAARVSERVDQEPRFLEAAAEAREKLGIYTDAQSLAAERVTSIKESLAAERVTAQRGSVVLTQKAAAEQRRFAAEAERNRLVGVVRVAQELLDAPDHPYEVTEAQVRETEQAEVCARGDAQLELTSAATLTSFENDLERLRKARLNAAKVPCHAEGIYAACPFLTQIPSEAKLEEVAVAAAEAAEAVSSLSGANARYDELRRQVGTRRSQLAAWTAHQARRQRAEDSVAMAGPAIQIQNQTMAEAESDLERLASEEAEATAAVVAVRERTEELAAAEETHRQVKTAVDRWASELHAASASLAIVNQAKIDLGDWQERRRKAAGEMATYKALAEAFHRNGIPSRILAGGIPLIEAEANRVLETLPGGLSINMRTERETQKGGISDTLDVIVTINGWEREYGLISVGARFRVDLAIRLGLGRVPTHRTGASIDTLFLDEPLAALDEEGKQAVVETLSALEDQFGLILVVSHNENFNDVMPSRIDIAMVDGVSSASLTA